MSLSRRDFFKLSGATLATAALVQHNTAVQAAPEPANPLNTSQSASTARNDPILRFLNRAGYGPRPSDYARASQMGLAAYLEEQLNPEQIDDSLVNGVMGGMTVYNEAADQLSSKNKATRSKASRELVQATILRATYSNRQLYEAMVERGLGNRESGIGERGVGNQIRRSRPAKSRPIIAIYLAN